MDKLLNCSYDNTPKFSLDGKTLESKCIDIYDGDSATFAVIVNGELAVDNFNFMGLKAGKVLRKTLNP